MLTVWTDFRKAAAKMISAISLQQLQVRPAVASVVHTPCLPPNPQHNPIPNPNTKHIVNQTMTKDTAKHNHANTQTTDTNTIYKTYLHNWQF